MAIPAINVLGNPNVTEGNFQIAIEDLRKSVIGSGKAYDSANTYSQYDTCVYGGIIYYSKINSNTGNTPAINANWGLIGDLFNLLINNGTVFGYGTGGTVVQLTNKSTAVTLNKPTGRVVMNNSSLAAGAYVSFNVYNTACSYGNVVVATLIGGVSSVSNYSITTFTRDGSLEISIKNQTGVTLSEAVEIEFLMLRGNV